MARIRFRAWDTEEKRWFPKNHREEWINISQTGEVIYGYEDGDPEDGDGRFAIMLSSGLKDRNGKEIYEGDILKNGTLIRPIIVDEQHGYRFHFGLDRLTRGDADYGEVIGNIYENPELLRS